MNPLSRNFDRFDNIGNHRVGRRAAQFGFGAYQPTSKKNTNSVINQTATSKDQSKTSADD